MFKGKHITAVLTVIVNIVADDNYYCYDDNDDEIHKQK
jgi:hypothetical protein